MKTRTTPLSLKTAIAAVLTLPLGYAAPALAQQDCESELEAVGQAWEQAPEGEARNLARAHHAAAAQILENEESQEMCFRHLELARESLTQSDSGQTENDARIGRTATDPVTEENGDTRQRISSLEPDDSSGQNTGSQGASSEQARNQQSGGQQSQGRQGSAGASTGQADSDEPRGGSDAVAAGLQESDDSRIPVGGSLERGEGSQQVASGAPEFRGAGEEQDTRSSQGPQQDSGLRDNRDQSGAQASSQRETDRQSSQQQAQNQSQEAERNQQAGNQQNRDGEREQQASNQQDQSEERSQQANNEQGQQQARRTAAQIGISEDEASQLAGGLSVSDEVIGQQVFNENREAIGTVSDIIIRLTEDGSDAYAVISSGGFIGIGSHDVLIPLQNFDMAGEQIRLPGASKEALQAMPPFAVSQN